MAATPRGGAVMRWPAWPLIYTVTGITAVIITLICAGHLTAAVRRWRDR